MTNSDMAEYGRRPVHYWLAGVDSGAFMLPSFQRSLVWNDEKTASYLEALFENRPTGLFLTLGAKLVGGKLQFACRPVKSAEQHSISQIQELILDGQQRLTTLWRAFNWQTLRDRKEESARRFYAEVRTFDDSCPVVVSVEPYTDKTSEGRALLDPKIAYEKNFVPIDILLNRKKEGSRLTEISEWCISACKDDPDREKSRILENSIRHLEKQILDRNLYYCVLNAEIERNTAIDIFLETNRSSVTVKRFDIAVAVAEGGHGENLREHIGDFYDANFDVVAHYFNRDREKMIPQLGEWLLKIVCLKMGKPPKETHYEDAVESLYKGNASQKRRRLEKIQENMKSALETAARYGSPNHRTLPSWPAIHVIAALQDDISSIRVARRKGSATDLISAYLWRAFFTDRYEAQANNRLFEDFQKLKKCLTNIKDSGGFSKEDDLPDIFDDHHHPLPDAAELEESASWINRGRLGRAIAALSLHQSPAPIDWATRERLDSAKIRELEDKRKLDRHHIFPVKFLGKSVPRQRIHNGLNGVLLSKSTNQSFSKKDPDEYLSELNVPDARLRGYVESHLVPYDALRKLGRRPKKKRYEDFLSQRAELVAAKLHELANIP